MTDIPTPVFAPPPPDEVTQAAEPTLKDLAAVLGTLTEQVTDVAQRLEALEADPVRSELDLHAWLTGVWATTYWGGRDLDLISQNPALQAEMLGLFLWWRRATSKKAAASDYAQWHDAAHKVIQRFDLWESRRILNVREDLS